MKRYLSVMDSQYTKPVKEVASLLIEPEGPDEHAAGEHTWAEHVRKYGSLIVRISVVGIIVSIVYGIVYVFNANMSGAVFLLVIGVTATLNILMYLQDRNALRSSSILIYLLAAVIMYSIITGGVGGTGIHWTFLFPVVAFFLSGLRYGIRWMLGFTLFLIIFSLLRLYGIVYAFYDALHILEVAGIMAIEGLFVYFYQSQSEKYEEQAALNHRMAEEQTKKLQESNDKMLKMVTQLETEKTKQEQQRKRLQAILNSIADGVVTTDVSGNIVSVNRSAQKLVAAHNKADTHVHYVDILNCVYESNPEKTCYDYVKKAVDTKETVSLVEDVALRRGDELVPVSILASPIIDDSGNVFGCVIAIRDESSERELEQLKTDFLSVAAHQLRTPLGGMRWMLDMVLNGDYGTIRASVRDALEIVRSDTVQLVQLVHDLLNATRIDQNRVADNPIEINVTAVVNEVVEDSYPQIQDKNVELHREQPEEGDVMLTIDRERIKIVIENLVSNAIKYSEDGDSITITLQETDTEVVFEVQDTGAGIPKKDQRNIFRKFYRASNALKSDTEGTGLGLFMVRSFVNAWGGSIHVDSKLDKGSTFTVRIPKNPVEGTLSENLLDQPQQKSTS